MVWRNHKDIIKQLGMMVLGGLTRLRVMVHARWEIVAA